jgi:hypothetical protein
MHLMKGKICEASSKINRGIDVVRDKIKGFAQKKINLGQGNNIPF